MHPSFKAVEMLGGVLAFAVDGELVPGCRWIRPEPRPLVTYVGPDPGCLGSAVARGLHLERCVIGEDRRTAQHVPADRIGQRLQKGCRLTDPVTERRPVKVDAFALENLALAIQGKVISIFADQDVRQQAGPRSAALDRP